jgi:hypothetical protein
MNVECMLMYIMYEKCIIQALQVRKSVCCRHDIHEIMLLRLHAMHAGFALCAQLS